MTSKEIIKLKKELLKNNSVPMAFIASDKRKYSFCSIIDCPAKSVLSVRNATNVLKFMPNSSAITIAEHNVFIADYLNLPRIDYMIIADNKDIVGGVNLVLTKNGIETGKYIGNPIYLKKGVAKLAVLTFFDFLRGLLPSDTEIFVQTKSDNSVNIALNEKLGYKIISEIDKDGFILMRRVI